MSSDAKPSAVRSNWWITHVFLFVWVGVLYAGLLVRELSSTSASHTTLVLAIQGWLFVFVLFLGASLLAFYYDAKAIARADREWRPRWWWYVIGTLLLTPAVTVPLYLVRRYRHIGIPWNDLRF